MSYHISSDGQCVTVLWSGEDLRHRGTASADRVGDEWWISRVLVQPDEVRGKGIGTEMLQVATVMIPETSECSQSACTRRTKEGGRANLDWALDNCVEKKYKYWKARE